MKNILMYHFKRQAKLILPVHFLVIIAALFFGNPSNGLLNAFVLSFFIIFTVIMGISFIEYAEDKNNAYNLYEILPLTKRRITSAKFLEILVLDILACLISLLILNVIVPENSFMEASRMIIVVSFGIALLMSAIYYTGVQLFGLDIFNKISIGFLVTGQGIAVFSQLQRVEELRTLTPNDVAMFFANLNILLVLGLPLFLFFALLLLTINVRRKT